MKSQFVVFFLLAMALALSAENNKGRRSNIRFNHLMKNQKDSPSEGRFLWKKKQQSAPANIFIIENNNSPTTSSTTGSTSSSPSTNTSRSINDDQFYDEDDNQEFSFDDDQILLVKTNKKQPKNLMPIKVSGNNHQGYEFIVPVKYIRNLDKNSNNAGRSGTFKKGVNKLRMVRLNGNNKDKRNVNARFVL